MLDTSPLAVWPELDGGSTVYVTGESMVTCQGRLYQPAIVVRDGPSNVLFALDDDHNAQRLSRDQVHLSESDAAQRGMEIAVDMIRREQARHDAAMVVLHGAITAQLKRAMQTAAPNAN